MSRLRNLPPRVIGTSAVVLGFAMTLVIFTQIFRVPFAPDTRTITADFASAAQLRAGEQVRMEGNVEGKIESVEPHDGSARVTMTVETDAGPVYADASARLRFKTLLGGSFYVEVERGTEAAGPLGPTVIPTTRTQVQNEIEDLTTVIRDGAVTGLQTLPGELGTALAETAAPGEGLATLSDIAPDAQSTVNALRGLERGVDMPELIHATAETVDALDADNDEIRTLVSGAAATLQTTAARSTELRTTLDAAPDVAFDLDATLARLDGTLGIARGLVSRLNGPAPDVAPTLAQLQPTLDSTASLLDAAGPIVAQAPGTIAALTRTGEQLAPLADGLAPALRRIDETILPYMARKDAGTGKSTSVMIGGFLAGGIGAGGAARKDANGHFIAFPASLGASSAYIPCRSSLVDPDAKSQLACDSFNEAFGNYLKYLPDAGSEPPPDPEAGR